MHGGCSLQEGEKTVFNTCIFFTMEPEPPRKLRNQLQTSDYGLNWGMGYPHTRLRLRAKAGFE
jgi:hypothetical protein